MSIINDLTSDETEDYVEEAAAGIVPPIEQQDEVLDEQMSEVEKRLEKASYYKLLLYHNFFNEDGQIAKDILKEVRSFIRERLSILLNLSQEAKPGSPAQAIFTDQEVLALKSLAKSTLANAKVLASQKGEKKKVPVTVNRLSITEKSPRLQEVTTPPVVVSAPKTQYKRTNVTLLEVDGKKYKKYTTRQGTEVCEEVDTGKKVKIVANDAGKFYIKDVTPVIRPSINAPQPIPMPNSQQMASITANNATIQASNSKVIEAGSGNLNGR